MRAVVQRVTSAKVTVSDEITGEIGRGVLVLLGVSVRDTPADADYLAAKKLVSERHNLLTNRLVVVVPSVSKVEVKELSDLWDPRIRRLALAEPKVPAGEYARQALQKAGIWEKVEARVVGAIDVYIEQFGWPRRHAARKAANCCSGGSCSSSTSRRGTTARTTWRRKTKTTPAA